MGRRDCRVLLLGALLATIRNMHMTVLDKFLAVVLIAIGVYAGWLFLDDLQYGLADVRRWLDPADRDAATRGREILPTQVHFGSECCCCCVGCLV